MLLISVLFGFLPLALATVQLQANFDIARYAGRWFENYRTTNAKNECSDVEAIVTPLPDGTVNVTNRQYLPFSRSWDSVEGMGRLCDPKEPAHYLVQCSPYNSKPGDYRVLYTDYDQVAVVYSLESYLFGWYNLQSAWVFARQQNATGDAIERCFEVLKERTGLVKEQFMKTPSGYAVAKKLH